MMAQQMTTSTIDPHFPQMAKILAPNTMQQVLQNTLFSQNSTAFLHLTIANCTIGEKRYKPGKSFLLSYQLGLQNEATHERHEQILTARACPVGHDITEFAVNLNNPIHTAVGIPAISYIPEIELLLWAFPHDRLLTHLPKLLDNDHLAAYFAQNRPTLGLSTSVQIVAIQTNIMHYLPESSCMIRYTLSVADAAKAGATHEIMLYGKNYPDDSGAETYSIMQQLAKQLAHTAKPLFYDADIRTLWQSHVSGKPFAWDADLTLKPERITRVARAIAAFHSCLVYTSGRYGFDDINKQLMATCKIAKASDAQLHPQIAATVQAIQRNQAQIDWSDTRYSPIHLDLKMGNILMTDDQVTLIDMDCVALGDPLADTGSFIASLYLNGLLAGAERAQIDTVVAVFRAKYGVAVGWAVDSAKLNWYIAAALIHEVVRRSLRQQNPQRLMHLSTIIELSNHYSALCRQQIVRDSDD